MQCKNCGGDLVQIDGTVNFECQYCHRKSTHVPEVHVHIHQKEDLIAPVVEARQAGVNLSRKSCMACVYRNMGNCTPGKPCGNYAPAIVDGGLRIKNNPTRYAEWGLPKKES